MSGSGRAAGRLPQGESAERVDVFETRSPFPDGAVGTSGENRDHPLSNRDSSLHISQSVFNSTNAPFFSYREVRSSNEKTSR